MQGSVTEQSHVKKNKSVSSINFQGLQGRRMEGVDNYKPV